MGVEGDPIVGRFNTRIEIQLYVYTYVMYTAWCTMQNVQAQARIFLSGRWYIFVFADPDMGNRLGMGRGLGLGVGLGIDVGMGSARGIGIGIGFWRYCFV